MSCVFFSFFRKEISWGVTGITLFLNFSLFEALAANLRAFSDDVGSAVLRASKPTWDASGCRPTSELSGMKSLHYACIMSAYVCCAHHISHALTLSHLPLLFLPQVTSMIFHAGQVSTRLNLAGGSFMRP